MLGGADNPNGELPSYITGADKTPVFGNRLRTSGGQLIIIYGYCISLYPDSPSMATSVQYAIHAGYTLFPTGYRPHKPEQNAGE